MTQYHFSSSRAKQRALLLNWTCFHIDTNSSCLPRVRYSGPPLVSCRRGTFSVPSSVTCHQRSRAPDVLSIVVAKHHLLFIAIPKKQHKHLLVLVDAGWDYTVNHFVSGRADSTGRHDTAEKALLPLVGCASCILQVRGESRSFAVLPVPYRSDA